MLLYTGTMFRLPLTLGCRYYHCEGKYVPHVHTCWSPDSYLLSTDCVS